MIQKNSKEREINTTVKGKMKKVVNVPVREGKITGSPVVPSFFASCVFEDAAIGKKSPSKTGSWGFHSAEKKVEKKTRKKKETKRAKIKNVVFFVFFVFFFFNSRQ